MLIFLLFSTGCKPNRGDGTLCWFVWLDVLLEVVYLVIADTEGLNLLFYIPGGGLLSWFALIFENRFDEGENEKRMLLF